MDPQDLVQVISVVTHQYRGVHSHVDFNGVDSTIKLHRIRDVFIFGPLRQDKNSALADRLDFKVAYERGGLDEVRLTCREAFLALEEEVLHNRPMGWEVEVEITGDGLRKARGVCHCEQRLAGGLLERTRVEGPWRKSRREAEQNMDSLLQAFSDQGLGGMQHVAALQKMTAVAPSVFVMPPHFAAHAAFFAARAEGESETEVV
jgi:hypothetical protein